MATHILMFPIPLQGPVKSMLKLAELLRPHFQITFLVTEHIHRRLLRHSNISDDDDSDGAGFRIRAIPDGLPEEHPRGGDDFLEILESLKKTSRPLLREMLICSSSRKKISCVVADGILGLSCHVAEEVGNGVGVFHVRTISAACLWVFFCLPRLIRSRDLPFHGDDLDTPIKSIPGMESYLRRRDLPEFCRSGDINHPMIELYKKEGSENPRAHGLILNTFEELEGPILSELRKVCPNIYTLGPLHAHLKVKQMSPDTFSNSLWQEDQTCVTWLDAQPPKSVIYVSFGSLALITHQQLMEFWYGLVNSEQRFLWVIRPDSVIGKDWEDRLPIELSKGTKERGYIVDWAPQEEVLAHSAIGGFLTHSGWNSTLESIYEGVPMICWPYFLDQQVNSRLVEAEWKLGLDMKDTCDRSTIENMVRDLMDVRKEEFALRAKHMENSAKASLSDGGTSHANLERLINDIKFKAR
ncbi:7-deoxyloganetic acid glucosyltransferase-like isoform X2 [Andrographis paniculata]|uniref:7-deoxyloganetic acid glucosyltransferase-like isoform X2 n=1 Tax=Andrographis paniculata TaxID=175694 RepID=UPI0021E8778A|nr:7-deoxyloganetic acid glucosyltransferase-like isoform X2 [Andrographis paniculata]